MHVVPENKDSDYVNYDILDWKLTKQSVKLKNIITR